MKEKGNIDPILRSLGGKYARYQMLQLMVINIGSFGAAYQLLDNIFIGRSVEGQSCAAPDDETSYPEIFVGNSTSKNITFHECEITISAANGSGGFQTYPCLHGYEYSYKRDMSFRTEFDLVCDRKLLGGLAQSFVIIGQGIGAVLSSIVSDRFGRKRTLVASQLGLFAVGMTIGFAPSYPVFAGFKFLVGCFQQGVMTTRAAMSIEMYPTEHRSLFALIGQVFWGCAATSMALVAFVFEHQPWRHLQYALSAASLLIAAFQLWYLDDSLRWLVTNGRQEASKAVLERAAATNGADIHAVLATLHSSHQNTELKPLSADEKTKDGVTQDDNMDSLNAELEMTLKEKKAEKLTLFDIFRHRTLLVIALVIWFAWFTCAFSFFALYMMSTSLVGNRFLNYFLTALMEIPPGVFLYLTLDRFGRKTSLRMLYILAGIGLIGGGICRIYSHIPIVGSISVAMSMIGMFGAGGMFTAVFFYTPELFPTNMRNQAIGISSFAGRLGGMISPFMNALAEKYVWAPGTMIGSLCFIVAALFHFLPDTNGRELPTTVEDVENWTKGKKRER